MTALRAALVIAVASLLGAGAAEARPSKGRALAIKKRSPHPASRGAREPKNHKSGAFARVAFGRAGELRDPKDAPIGRRSEPLTAEEVAAAEIQKLLRGPLRRGVTGLYVADARTGEPLFAVNADDRLNPASNVKMISTATALELLGPDFKYPTRLIGPTPIGGVVDGDVYLLGSYDPTLTTGGLDDLAAALAARGITSIKGSIVVGSDPTRDGVYRAVVPISISAGEPGHHPTAAAPPGFDLVDLHVTATTSKRAKRAKLTYKTEQTKGPSGEPRISLVIGGTIGKDQTVNYPLWTKQRTAVAAHWMLASLRARSVVIAGGMKVKELGDFIGDAVSNGALPIELARHESQPVSEIVARINKWSINWLADRLVMTASALARGQQPSMDLALETMYGWLDRHPHISKDQVLIDTGSGLSYRTQISSTELVSIVRSAGGFTADTTDPQLAGAWKRSLAVAGTDGTLRNRFRSTDFRGRIFGKTGTLSTVIALSGILDVDPQRPLAFALVTNGDSPLSKAFVRRAHELVIGEICKYLAKTRTTPLALPLPGAAAPAEHAAPELEETEPDSELDAETADSP